jgi:hypothetical protein
MAAPPKYTAQVVVMVEPEVAAEIAAWATHGRMSASLAARKIIEAGLRTKRREWIKAYGELSENILRTALVLVHERARRQIERRRRNDSDRRRNEPTTAGVPTPPRGALGGSRWGDADRVA